MSDENKSRISLVCAPHDGSRSPAFLKFQRDFRAGTQAEFVKDDEYSVWQALNDIDQGGQDPNAPAMPGGNALAPAQRKRLRRQALAYKMVYAHIDDDSIYIPSTEQQARERREKAFQDPASGDQVKIPYRFHRDR